MAFTGFSKETLDFFSRLKKNNTKKWFEANRSIFDKYVMAESELFVLALGERLREFAPEINAIPKTDKSIFRIYRDVRFSKEKHPYKTHLAILFWEGNRKKTECPGFYFHLEPNRLFLAAGVHIFTPDLLAIYRDAVVDKKQGLDLEKALKKINANKKYQLGWEKYKKIPRGYDADHPRAALLRMGGLGFSFETSNLNPILSPKAVDFCYNVYKDFSPLHIWLRTIFKHAV